MLGYITWHPLTTFASLRSTAEFVERYEAPPKLLRRVLRLYSHTKVVEDVRRLGLLDASHRRGWQFQDGRLEALERTIDRLFASVNKRRDRLRTIEKAAAGYRYPVSCLPRVKQLRQDMDSLLCRLFRDGIDAAAAPTTEESAVQIAEFSRIGTIVAEELAQREEVDALISTGFAECGFERHVVDLFRK
jgi:hypothetical protein